MQVTALLALLLTAAPAEGEIKNEPPAPAAVETRTPSFGFDRVDVLSEDTGTWLHYDLPMFGAYALTPTLRFLEQVKVVFRLPVKGLTAGVSINSQSLVYEHPLWADKGLFVTGGLQTRLLFPRGVLVGVAWRAGIFRVGLSMSAFTSGSWSRPQETAVTVLPTLGLGIGGAYVP